MQVSPVPSLRPAPSAADLPSRVTPEEEAMPVARVLLPQYKADYDSGEVRWGVCIRALGLVRRFFDEAETHMVRLRFGRPVCDRTDSCCEHTTPLALEIEAEDIANRLWSLPHEDQVTISRQVGTWLISPLAGATEATQVVAAEHLGCPFYDSTKRSCLIEDWRPLACRARGVFNAPRSTCTAVLVGTETAERRQVLSFTPNSGWDRFSRAIAAQAAGYTAALFKVLADTRYGVLSGFLPWLVYRKETTAEVADAQASAGRFTKVLTGYPTRPHFFEWAMRGALSAGLLHEEDQQLAHEGKAPVWHKPIYGQDALGLPAPLTQALRRALPITDSHPDPLAASAADLTA